MKKVLFIMTMILCLSCNKSVDFSQLKEGMTSKEVVKLIGKPDDKTDFFEAEIWMYKTNDSGWIVTIIQDTVAGFQGGSDLETTLEDMNEGLEELESTIDTHYNN